MTSKTFTEDEKKDICKSYRLAKDPAKQIKTLAELNACYKSDIECVLRESGLLTKKNHEASLPNIKNFKPIVPIGDVLEKKPRSKHSWEDWEIKDLILLKAKGLTNTDLAEHFGVSVPALNNQVFLHRAEIDAKIFELKVDAAQEENKPECSSDKFIAVENSVEAAKDIVLADDSPENKIDPDPDLMTNECTCIDSIYSPRDDMINFLEDFKSQFSGLLKLDSNSDLYYFGLKMGIFTSRADDLLRRLKSIGK